MPKKNKFSLILKFIYFFLFLFGMNALFHGFPDIERFFAEWMDERLALNYIIKFGTLSFAPTQVWHPPLYYYLTFIPTAMFFSVGRWIGLFHDKVDFVRFYFNYTHYFFFIGRLMSYIFYWLSAVVVYKIVRLYYSRVVAHLSVLSYLMIPRLIFDFSVTRPETLLFLNTSLFFYFFLKYYFNSIDDKYLICGSFFLGLSIATKYNAILLGFLFIPVFLLQFGFSNFRKIFTSFLKVFFFILLGFFIGDPFFILQFKKYFYNFTVYSKVEMWYYYLHSYTIFGLTHLREIVSFMYLNVFGFLILILGASGLFKKDRKIFTTIFITALLYEIYFSLIQKHYSPLRYLNPLLPAVILIFAAGIDAALKRKIHGVLLLVIFATLLAYNYFNILVDLSFRPSYLQEARTFIEKNIPEFANICIASDSKLPQLNMTEKSYYHLMQTAPKLDGNPEHELKYKNMDNVSAYDDIFWKLRIESLTKQPQYNLFRWEKNIATLDDALGFFTKNKIRYLISNGPCMLGDRRIDDAGLVSLWMEFTPCNIRIYGEKSLYLYAVK